MSLAYAHGVSGVLNPSYRAHELDCALKQSGCSLLVHALAS